LSRLAATLSSFYYYIGALIHHLIPIWMGGINIIILNNTTYYSVQLHVQ
jgi:hypothetical protein